jgi:DNA-binding Lrp family transcriptional regulator
MKAVEDGLTKEEFAKRVGLKPATIYQRVYELRKSGLNIPLLVTSARLPLAERAKAILADYQKPKAKAKKTEPREAQEVDEQEEVVAAISDPIAELLG